MTKRRTRPMCNIYSAISRITCAALDGGRKRTHASRVVRRQPRAAVRKTVAPAAAAAAAAPVCAQALRVTGRRATSISTTSQNLKRRSVATTPAAALLLQASVSRNSKRSLTGVLLNSSTLASFSSCHNSKSRQTSACSGTFFVPATENVL